MSILVLAGEGVLALFLAVATVLGPSPVSELTVADGIQRVVQMMARARPKS